MISGLPEGGTEQGPRKYPVSRDRMLLSCGLAAALLFWAAIGDDQSHGFYTFLRIYVCGLSLFCTYAFHTVNRAGWALAGLCSAILFNPLLPVQLDRETWQVLDFIIGAVFGWLALQSYARRTGRRWAPYAPGAAVLALVVASQIEPGSRVASQTMNVDNLAVDNLVVNDTTGSAPVLDRTTAADANMTAAAASADGSERSASDEATADANTAGGNEAENKPEYSGDRLRSRPDGSADTETTEEATDNPYADLIPEDGEQQDGSEEGE